MAIVIGKIQGKQLEDPKQMQEILDDLKNVKTDDVRKQLVLVEEDGKADLYFVPKEKIEKYKKDAVLDLYGMDSLDYSKIISLSSSVLANSIKSSSNSLSREYLSYIGE